MIGKSSTTFLAAFIATGLVIALSGGGASGQPKISKKEPTDALIHHCPGANQVSSIYCCTPQATCEKPDVPPCHTVRK
jgi:hypothetical protein